MNLQLKLYDMSVSSPLRNLNILLNNEELLRMEEYIEVRQSTAEFCKVMYSSDQNSQILLETVEFSKILSGTEKNCKEPQIVDDFDWEEFLRELL